MALDDVFELVQTPSCINAYWLHAAAQVESWESAKELPIPIWYDLYASTIQTYDARGQEFTQQRALIRRNLRENVSFCDRWTTKGIACVSPEREPTQIRRPGVQEKWNYLMQMSAQTCWFKPEDMARALVFEDEIRSVGDHLVEFKRDLYSAAYQAMHVVNSDKKWLGWLTAPGATTGYFRKNVPGETYTPPWRFAEMTESCSECVDTIYLDDSIDAATQILPLQVDHIKKLQYDIGYEQTGQEFAPVTIITDVETQMDVSEKSPFLINAALYQNRSGGILTPSLAGDFNISNFVKWKNDKLPLRYRVDPDQTGPNGEVVLVNVPPFLDVNNNAQGQRSEMNPDYLDADVAAFQINVVWEHRTFTPRRPVFGTQFGKMSIDDQMRGQFQWINTKDNTFNRTGDRGYFFIQDDMMFASNRYSVISNVVLSRRPADDAAAVINTQALREASAENEILTETCADMAPKPLSDEACALQPGGPGYTGGGCIGCQ